VSSAVPCADCAAASAAVHRCAASYDAHSPRAECHRGTFPTGPSPTLSRTPRTPSTTPHLHSVRQRRRSLKKVRGTQSCSFPIDRRTAAYFQQKVLRISILPIISIIAPRFVLLNEHFSTKNCDRIIFKQGICPATSSLPRRHGGSSSHSRLVLDSELVKKYLFATQIVTILLSWQRQKVEHTGWSKNGTKFMAP